MGISSLPYRYRFNGVVDTSRPVMENLEDMCSAAQSWLTYDALTGKWAVIINKADDVVASFDDSNIIGGISLSGTGLTDFYNSVRVEFPHQDLQDNLDYVEETIDSGDLYPNEIPNELAMYFDIQNDPVSSELLGRIELRQSRVDRVIRFETDYSYLGLKAGDIIEVTNSVLGFTDKKFRIISISEFDTNEGTINTSITALEFDADVYDTSGLYRYLRSIDNGLISLGAIDTPAAPVLTAVEANSRPSILMTATIPSGIVQDVEFWYSITPGHADNTFILAGTKEPRGGGTFTTGSTVTLEFNQVEEATYYVKCRAFNRQTTSPWSAVTTLTDYAPLQTAGAVGQDSEIISTVTGDPVTGTDFGTVAGWALSLDPNWTSTIAGFGYTSTDFLKTTGAPADVTTSVLNLFYSPSYVDTQFNNIVNTWDIYGPHGSTGIALDASFVLPFDAKLMTITAEGVTGTFDYQWYYQPGSSIITSTGYSGQFPMEIGVYLGSTLVQAAFMEPSVPSVTLALDPALMPGGVLSGTWHIKYAPSFMSIPAYVNPYYGYTSTAWPTNLTSYKGVRITAAIYQ